MNNSHRAHRQFERFVQRGIGRDNYTPHLDEIYPDENLEGNVVATIIYCHDAKKTRIIKGYVNSKEIDISKLIK